MEEEGGSRRAGNVLTLPKCDAPVQKHSKTRIPIRQFRLGACIPRRRVNFHMELFLISLGRKPRNLHGRTAQSAQLDVMNASLEQPRGPHTRRRLVFFSTHQNTRIVYYVGFGRTPRFRPGRGTLTERILRQCSSVWTSRPFDHFLQRDGWRGDSTRFGGDNRNE